MNVERTAESLLDDLKAVLRAAEDFSSVTSREAGDKLTDARRRLEVTLKDVRHRVNDAEALLIEKAKQVAESTDTYVHSNPWKSVALGAGIALLLGLFIARR